MRHRLLISAGLVLAFAAEALSAGSDAQMIRGTLTVTPDLAQHIGPDDRLIIKLYHPENGIEMDAKYQISFRAASRAFPRPLPRSWVEATLPVGPGSRYG
jgi:hypothetical protein